MDARTAPTGARVAWSGLAALAVAMGIGRFAFTPLLPMMQADAGLSLVQGGWIALDNYLGYFAGALWLAAHPVPPRQAIRAGLAIIGATTLAMGLTHSVFLWLVLRFFSGIASAFVLIHISDWALRRLGPLRRPLLQGIVYAGVGAGMACAGLMSLAMMQARMSSGTTWIALGALSLVVVAVCWPAYGAEQGPMPAAKGRIEWNRANVTLVACYGVFGFGYIIPATYLPAMARILLDESPAFGLAWPLFGAAAAASTLLAAPMLGRMDNRSVWAASHLAMAGGVAAPLALPDLGGVYVASLCVGGTFMVATMTGLAEGRRRAGPAAATMMAAMSAAFAAGQILGPAFLTWLLQFGGSLPWGLAVASAALATSAFVLMKPT